ncbi:hypothetical protein CRG98_004857 [Punica granatum]|uniref:Uncharacterized protein n=1 Tax=Punica granatum TaxID=22663 RepID=A0A2I0L242_PUNGR|nr:hypothetical protein CRG98_004857 [Punica granatum]
MEAKFHAQFHRTQPEVTLVDLTRLRSKDAGPIFLKINFEFELKKKFEGMGFQDFFDLASKPSSYGDFRKKKLIGNEIIMDKLVSCPLLVRAKGGKDEKPNAFGQVKYYTFNVLKTHETFDFLVKSGLVKFGLGHKHLTVEEIHNRDFCPFHGSWRPTIRFLKPGVQL